MKISSEVIHNQDAMIIFSPVERLGVLLGEKNCFHTQISVKMRYHNMVSFSSRNWKLLSCRVAIF